MARINSKNTTIDFEYRHNDIVDNSETEYPTCKCPANCPYNCKGECGCEACKIAYADFLSEE